MLHQLDQHRLVTDKVRNRSTVTPPCVTRATGPGSPAKSTKQARNRSAASREESPEAGTKSRSFTKVAQSARKPSKGWGDSGCSSTPCCRQDSDGPTHNGPRASISAGSW